MPAKPRRKGIFEGSHGVMLPPNLPALDQTMAPKSGTRVQSTMMKLLRCIQSRYLSCTQSQYANAIATKAKSGIHVKDEVSARPTVTSERRTTSGVAAGCGAEGSIPSACFLSG